jgi:hypothetical protein
LQGDLERRFVCAILQSLMKNLLTEAEQELAAEAKGSEQEVMLT